eukprot:scpid49099/ scgid27963/ L-fucose kinase
MAQLHAWDVIVITCRDEPTAGAYEKELKVRQAKGLIAESTRLLAVADPDARVGSGGATLNALLVAAELLSSQDGYTAVTEDVLKKSEGRPARKILILHMGRDFPFDACSRCFVSIPGLWNVNDQSHLALCSVMTHLDYLLYMLDRICAGSPPGVWVSSSDMILFDKNPAQSGPMINWSDFTGGVMAVAIPGSKDYAKRHGVYRIGEQSEICDIVFQGNAEQIDACSLDTGLVPIVSGIVFMCPNTASKLLDLQSEPPLENCTYLGIDSGNSPLNVSLYFDMLLSLAKDVSQAEYEAGSRPGTYGQGSAVGPGSTHTDSNAEDRRKARAMVWKRLRLAGVTMHAGLLSNLEHDYIDLYPRQYIERLQRLGELPDVVAGQNSFVFGRKTHSFVKEMDKLSDSSVLVNCLCSAVTTVGENTVMMNCRVEVPGTVSSGCLLNSVTFSEERCKGMPSPFIIPENTAVLSFSQRADSDSAVVCFGTKDELEGTAESGTFCGDSWAAFFQRTGIASSDLWDEDCAKKTLLNARLFRRGCASLAAVLWLSGGCKVASEGQLEAWRAAERVSIADVLPAVNVAAEFSSRSRLSAEIVVAVQRHALHTCQPLSWVSSFRSTARNGHADLLFTMLDGVASESADPGVRARALAGIADVLAAVAGDGNGLRSGPGANRGWKAAYKQLQEGNVKEGVALLAAEREKWMNSRQALCGTAPDASPLLRPRELLRAARHYEGAAQILISQAVKTAEQFATIKHEEEPVPMGKWVKVEAPARADIAGGWSDTPPITYEHGGSVTNVAFMVKGKRPIGAKVKRIEEPLLRLCLVSAQPIVVECKELSDMEDYCIPTAKAALLKTAFYCMKVVDLQSSVSLRDQLMSSYGGGFELHTWSDLPSGSGLGTSSILAGVVIAAILKVVGHAVDKDAVTHMVLMVEQMLTTGGGWQDQAGGLFGGVKISRSPRQLPLRVEVEPLNLSEETLREFNRRFVVIYTGRTRLARNILQEVIRSWYGQLPRIVNTAKALVAGSEECAEAFRQGDLEKVGACMSRYWEQKKVMAYGCEPDTVRQFMKALKPHVYGQSMAGAGGGGFMYVLMKEPDTGAEVAKRVLDESNITSFEVYGSALDPNGLWIEVEQ